MEETQNEQLAQSHDVLKAAVSRCCRDFRERSNHETWPGGGLGLRLRRICNSSKPYRESENTTRNLYDMGAEKHKKTHGPR